MQSKEKKNIIFIRLFPNEDVNEQLKQACKLHDVKTAIVLSGIGQLKKAQLGYFKGKGNYSSKIINKPLELLSLTGNISKQGENYILHLHSVLGDQNKNAIGGHFIGGIISITGEIVLLKINLLIQRKLEKEIGLNGLYLE